MLVLTRKKGEKILIDGGITITIIETSGNRVRLGIEAPRTTEVWREELKREKRDDSGVGTGTGESVGEAALAGGVATESCS